MSDKPTTDAPPPYTLARSSSGHEAIWANGQELSNSLVLSHLNGQEAALVEAMKELREAREHIAALLDELPQPNLDDEALDLAIDAARAFLRGA